MKKLVSSKTFSVEQIQAQMDKGLAPFQNSCEFLIETVEMYEASKGIVITLKGEEQTAKMPEFRLVQAVINSGLGVKDSELTVDAELFIGEMFIRDEDGERFVSVAKEEEEVKTPKKKRSRRK